MMRQAKQLLRPWVDRVAAKAGNSYISGPDLTDAQRASDYLVRYGYWVTQGYWNGDDEDPLDVAHLYRRSMQRLADVGGKNYISIKAPAIHFDQKIYLDIMQRSNALNVPVHFDAHGVEDSDRLFSLIESNQYYKTGKVGVTLPGRWRRSLDDVAIARQLGLEVRVVKGQWQDPAEPDRDAGEGFLSLVNELAGQGLCVRIATHNVSLAREALGALIQSDTPCELELLYGLPLTEMVPLAKEMAVPVRVYVPYGCAYLPYCLSTMLSKPRLAMKILKDMRKGDYLNNIPCLQPENK